MYNAVFQSLTLANGKSDEVDSSTLSTKDKAAYETLTSEQFFDDAYEFCSGTCYVIAVNFYDPYDKYINPYFLSVNKGSCADSFSTVTGDDAWKNLINNPPTPLIESYYVCSMGEKDALISAVGVTMGNLGAIQLPLILFVVILGYIVRFKMIENQNFIYPYDTVTRNKVLNEMAVYYLRVRDGTMPPRPEDDVFIKRMADGCTTAIEVENKYAESKA